MKSFMICSSRPISFVRSNRKKKYVIGGAYTAYDRVYTGFSWGKQRKRDHLEDPGVDGRIILRWIFRKWDVWTWTVLIWLGMGRGGGNLLIRNGTSGSIKYGEFVD